MDHVAVRDLEKAYYKGDRKLLLKLKEKWRGANSVAMVRALLGPIFIRANNDPTDFVAKMTRRLPQGAPSSPLLFNMPIDSITMAAEASINVRNGEGAVVVVSDDVLIQAKSQATLQRLINITEDWQKEKKNKWSVAKYTYLEIRKGEGRIQLDNQIRKREAETYLGMKLEATEYHAKGQSIE